MNLLTLYGAAAVTLMLGARLRGGLRRFVPLRLAGAWPFGVVEAVWALVARRRWQRWRRPTP